MSVETLQPEPLTASRDALDALASLPIEGLRRLAVRLDDEARIVRTMLRERSRRPERAAGLSVLAEEDCTQ
jgi:hypothetical protein